MFWYRYVAVSNKKVTTRVVGNFYKKPYQTMSPVKRSGVSTEKLPASKYTQKVYCLSAKTGAKKLCRDNLKVVKLLFF